MTSTNCVRASLASICLIATFAYAPTARSDVAAESLQEIMSATSGFGLCFGFGRLVVADVHPSPGDEILFLRKKVIVQPDNNQDGSRVLRHEVSVIAKSSSTNQILWESPTLFVNSADAFVTDPTTGFSAPPFAFNPGLFFRFSLIFGFGAECAGITIATYNGQAKVVVGAGTSVATGTPEQGQDQTRLRFRVLNGTSGANERTHTILPQNGFFLAPALPTITDLDDNGNSDLVIWRAQVKSDTRVTVFARSYDLLSGAAKQVVALPLNDTIETL